MTLRSSLRWLRILPVALLPVLVNTALSIHFFTAPARASVPYYNDEVAYWNQIAVFQAAGFSGGYVTVNERTAAAGWSRFGPHGPAFPALYGSVARLFGWHTSSPVDFNFVFVSIAALAWIAATRPPLPLAASALGLFWPLMLALTTAMQEPLQYAVALLLATAIVLTVRVSRRSAALTGGVAILMTVSSLLRPTWTLLLAPWLGERGGSARRSGLAAVAGLAVALAAYLFFTQVLAAPYPGAPSAGASSLFRDPIVAMKAHLTRAAGNAVRFISWADSAPLEVVYRYGTLAVLAALCMAARGSRQLRSDAHRLLAIAAWFLLLTVAAVVAAGDVGAYRDYRLLTPALFLALLLAVNAQWKPAWVVAVAHLLLLPLAASAFAALYEPKFRADRTRIERLRADMVPVLSFQPGAPGWVNTVLVPVDRYEYPLLGLPAGMGLSTFFAWDQLELPIKSRYVLLQPRDRETAPAGVRLRELRRTSHGTLYENVDWRMLESRR